MTTTTFPFAELPAELQVHILRLVADKPRDHALIDSVCRAWRSFSCIFWRQLGTEYEFTNQTSCFKDFKTAYMASTQRRIHLREFQKIRLTKMAPTDTSRQAPLTWEALAQLRHSEPNTRFHIRANGLLDFTHLMPSNTDSAAQHLFSSAPILAHTSQLNHLFSSFTGHLGGLATKVVIHRVGFPGMAWVTAYQVTAGQFTIKLSKALPQIPYQASFHSTPNRLWLAVAMHPNGQVYSLDVEKQNLSLRWHCTLKFATKLKQFQWLEYGSEHDIYLCGRQNRRLVVWPVSNPRTGMHMLTRGAGKPVFTQMVAKAKRKAQVLLEDQEGCTLLDFAPVRKRRKMEN